MKRLIIRFHILTHYFPLSNFLQFAITVKCASKVDQVLLVHPFTVSNIYWLHWSRKSIKL